MHQNLFMDVWMNLVRKYIDALYLEASEGRSDKEEINLVCTSQCIHVLVVRMSMSLGGYMARIADEFAVCETLHAGKTAEEEPTRCNKVEVLTGHPPA
jgi:hypothetical protein